ncbi:LamG domain-containing protein, partial [Gillisia marina]|uniref:LamG domain-containing protein n=1 Tax=Gillisia marina TaxID=1167637 RepID=UPI00029ADD0B
TGVLEQGLRFNGSSQYATAADNASLDISNSITIATWIRPEKMGTQYLIKKAEHGATDGYELSLSSSGKLFFRFNQQTSGNSYRIDSQASYPSNGTTWMHVAVSYDGSTIRLYINGVENNTKVISSSPSISINALTLTIGAGNGGYRGLQGAMDDTRIYNTALSA